MTWTTSGTMIPKLALQKLLEIVNYFTCTPSRIRYNEIGLNLYKRLRPWYLYQWKISRYITKSYEPIIDSSPNIKNPNLEVHLERERERG